MALSRILDINGTYSLTFYCGELPADAAITESGHEPNGYFWEGVATILAPDLVNGLELDSEAGMFSATGKRSDLGDLQTLIEPVLASPAAVRAVIDRAGSEGFEFDD